MVGYFTLILLCQLAGEVFVKVTDTPVPGPVIGMVILFAGLYWRDRLPVELEATADVLHRNLALFFVPAGVGIITNLDLMAKSWAPLAGAILLGTAVTIGVTGLVMQRTMKRRVADSAEIPS